MAQNLMVTRKHVAITTTIRDRLVAADAVLREALKEATSRRRHVLLDISDAGIRRALTIAIRPMLSRQPETPPALVGFARRVVSAIEFYEIQISNYDLFEDRLP
jgi:hypothetical protein